MNDKQRAEFEKWCESKGYCTNRSERYGDYITGYTDELWQAWQAAIASVVVDIPKAGLGFEDVFYMRGDQVVSALEKAGIRYE